MVTGIVRRASLFACLALLAGPAGSQTAPQQTELINALRDGGSGQRRQAEPAQRRWLRTCKIDRRTVAQNEDSGWPGPRQPVQAHWLVVTPIENNRRAAALRKMAGTMPPAGTNVIVVTHKPNILDAFGKDWFDVREGEASVFKPDGNGGYKSIVRIQAGDWSRLAQGVN